MTNETGKRIPALKRRAEAATNDTDRKLRELFKLVEAHGIPGDQAQRLGLVSP